MPFALLLPASCPSHLPTTHPPTTHRHPPNRPQPPTAPPDSELHQVLDALEAMSHHLTAAVVSNDIPFLQTVLANTVNGTTYAGIRARTTGAPQNHWFGPAGDPRGAGIGTPEAIKLVWSCHREIIQDVGPAPAGAALKTT
jgi:1-pyrroline-5-carboxylate dehydrogenase